MGLDVRRKSSGVESRIIEAIYHWKPTL